MDRWLIYGLVAIAVLVLLAIMRWQKTMQAVPAGLEVEPIHAQDDIPLLNLDRLIPYSQKFQDLGCVHRMDGQLSATVGEFTPSFVRLLQHPEHRYWVLLIQALPSESTSHIPTCTILSLLNDDWLILTTTERPTLITPQIQLDHQPWLSRPSAAPTQLIEMHIQLRSQLISDLNLTVQDKATPEDVWIRLKERAWRQKQIAKRQNPAVSFLKLLPTLLKPQSDWLGDYRK